MMKSPGVFFSEKILDTFELIAQYLGQESIVWFYNRQFYEWLWWQRVEESFEKILDGFELYSAVFKPRISCLICQLISHWIIFGTKIWPKNCQKILDTFEAVMDVVHWKVPNVSAFSHFFARIHGSMTFCNSAFLKKKTCENILDTFEPVVVVVVHSKEEKTLQVTEICSIWLKTGQKQPFRHFLSEKAAAGHFAWKECCQCRVAFTKSDQPQN